MRADRQIALLRDGVEGVPMGLARDLRAGAVAAGLRIANP